MKDFFCIIIDDNSDVIGSATIQNIKDRVKKYAGLNIEFKQLNPKETKYINEDDGSINISNVLQVLDSKEYLKREVHLIICDYELGDDQINGFEVIRKIRNDLNSKKQIILYSSNIDNVIKKIFDGSEDHRIKKIKDLVASKISEFCPKDEHLEEAILKILKQESMFSSDKFIESELFRYSDHKFKNVYDKFENKTLGEVAYIISTQVDEAFRLKKELLEQLIAFMID